jgi:hypothetical protein
MTAWQYLLSPLEPWSQVFSPGLTVAPISWLVLLMILLLRLLLLLLLLR